MGMQTRMIQAWIARDEDGTLCHHSEKPYRSKDDMFLGQWETADGTCGELPPKMFPEITWDDEPRKVEISIKLL